ncbi:alkaline phosphatase PafA [Formosa sp. PL04]|uniref:alkaline phosphatase PafA n=1 Tax=Formosa sp. PL04 TaxID=3081755 RepID=UPI0029828B35|nr:alkaline phosphatase PafA [Formosa sp. PL04]MDW5287730.1 alkaline phosphatase PafA [Formosa sp. PL04]
MKNSILLFAVCLLCASSFAQKVEDNLPSKIYVKPKLVVGIVVDQMRYDYLTRFYNKYGDGGFKRMMNEGFNCKNNHFNYIPTKTAPGHASIYTGTSPMNHGVVGNDWYDKETKSSVYCAGDSTVSSVGTEDKAGKMSPHRMLTTTFADENRFFTQMEGKTIGVSIKDRGAILPAGHTANAAYWFHGKDEGVFISSTYYQDELPKWVNNFNSSKTAKSYLKDWNTLYSIKKYTESGDDLNDFESGFKGKETATFPYDLKDLSKENGGFDIIKATPYGNSIVADFAIAAIKGEDLGADDITDVLTVSFSSTDYVGHNFGVNSKEIEDTYIRLDNDLERLFDVLDKNVGKGEYTVFLTADHGAVDVPSYLHAHDVPAGYFGKKEFKEKLDDFMTKKYGSLDLIEDISNNQIFLDRKKVNQLNLNLANVQQEIANELITYENIYIAYSATVIANNGFTNGMESLLKNGYNQKRSGDVLYQYNPAVISYPKKGSTHGSGLNYDTHVPLLFFGKGIKQGSTLQKTEIIDIAPTISGLLGISFPNGSTGQPLEFVLENE